MKQKLEKIIKRENGSRVKIIVEISTYNYRDVIYSSHVLWCEKGKRTWRGTFDGNSYDYRRLSMEDRQKSEYQSQFSFVSEQEILQAKIELWESLNPELIKDMK